MKLSKSAGVSLLLVTAGLICAAVYLLLRKKFDSKSDTCGKYKIVDRNDPKHTKIKDLLEREFYDL